MTRVAIILLLGVTLQAGAQQSLEDLTRKYDAFRKTHAGVSLVLLFNQEKFAPGDTAWFKAHFLNSDRSPVKGRLLINVALVSFKGEVLQRFLFVAKDGTGFNQLVFPADIQPGFYTIVAYNNWMKNFTPPPLFSKQVTIVREKEVLKDGPSATEHRLSVRPNLSREMVAITFSSQEGAATRFQALDLMVTTNHKVAHARTFRQALDDSVTFHFKTTPGIYYVAIIDKMGRVVASQSYEMDSKRNDDKVTVKIEKGSEVFNTRGKGALSVTLIDSKGQPVQGEFAFKVLNGMVVARDPEPIDPLSDALMQQREPWRQIMNGPVKLELEFATRFLRKGTAMMRDGTPVPPDTKLVFYLQHSDVILQAQSYTAGRFSLSLPDIGGNDELLAFAEHDGVDVPVASIVWDETPINLPRPPLSHEGDNVDDYGAFASTTRLIDKSFGFYATGPANAPISRKASYNSALEERLNGDETNIDVQKYVTFGTMTELIIEIVPGLATRTTKERASVKVSLPEPMAVASSDPLYIIDGVVTRNTAFFLSLRPIELARIKLVTSPSRLMPLGLIGKNGIVIVETLKGNVHPPAAPWQVIEGIQPALSFRSKPRPDRPDFRSTIYWAPAVQTDANGKARVEFYWSDDVGPVRVNVTGMTKDGRFFGGEEEFEVRLEKE